MDTRILIQRPTATPDSQGSVINAWTDLATVWAKAEAVPSVATQETVKENERRGSQDYRFTVRFQTALASLSTADRVRWNGRNHNILAAVPMPEGRPDSIVITARRRA